MIQLKLCNKCDTHFEYDWHVEYSTCPTCDKGKSNNVVDTEPAKTPDQLRVEFQETTHYCLPSLRSGDYGYSDSYVHWLEEKLLKK